MLKVVWLAGGRLFQGRDRKPRGAESIGVDRDAPSDEQKGRIVEHFGLTIPSDADDDHEESARFMMCSRILGAEQFEEARRILRQYRLARRPHDLLFDRIHFVMNATASFFNTNQHKIIKLVSEASVALRPPTPIERIYGMNFKVDARTQRAPRLSGRDRADSR